MPKIFYTNYNTNSKVIELSHTACTLFVNKSTLFNGKIQRMMHFEKVI